MGTETKEHINPLPGYSEHTCSEKGTAPWHKILGNAQVPHHGTVLQYEPSPWKERERIINLTYKRTNEKIIFKGERVLHL